MNPILALILANLIWGAGPPIFKLALGNIPPFTLAFLRFFIAGVVFFPLAFRQRLRALNWRDWMLIAVGSFFGIVLNITFYFLGLKTAAPSINVTIIASGGPVFIFLLSILFLHERARWRTSLGMLVALSGVMLLIFEPLLVKGQLLSNGISAWRGNILYVFAAVSSVLFTIIIKDVLKKVSAYVVLSFGFLFSSLLFLPAMLQELNNWHFSELNSAGLFGILFGVVFSSIIAYGLYYYGLSRITAQESGIFTYLDPVAGVLVAMPLLHEYPTTLYFASLALIILGVYISEGRIHYHPLRRLRVALHVGRNPEDIRLKVE